MVDQVILSQPGGADNTHHIITGTPGFLDLPTALPYTGQTKLKAYISKSIKISKKNHDSSSKNSKV